MIVAQLVVMAVVVPTRMPIPVEVALGRMLGLLVAVGFSNAFFPSPGAPSMALDACVTVFEGGPRRSSVDGAAETFLRPFQTLVRAFTR